MIERRSIDLPGATHEAPVPMACRVGNVLFSSRISGRDIPSGNIPADPAEQARLMFQNLEDVLKLAGGSLQNVGHVTVLIVNDEVRGAFNDAWERAFPDPDSRPARHVEQSDLRHGLLFQVEVTAVF